MSTRLHQSISYMRNFNIRWEATPAYEICSASQYGTACCAVSGNHCFNDKRNFKTGLEPFLQYFPVKAHLTYDETSSSSGTSTAQPIPTRTLPHSNLFVGYAEKVDAWWIAALALLRFIQSKKSAVVIPYLQECNSLRNRCISIQDDASRPNNPKSSNPMSYCPRQVPLYCQQVQYIQPS
jgi:hypothetical protein